MIKTLITGGAGYIGSILIPFLLNEGFKVTIYDLLLYGGHSVLPFISNKNFFFIKGDIRDRETLNRHIKKNDIIVHLAAIVGLPACNKDKKLAYSTNVTGTKNIIDNLSPNQQLIHASTVSNYGASTGDTCDENTPLEPISCYGKTKTEAEKIVLEFKNTICLRFATAFGVSPRMRLDLLINDFVYQAYINKFLILFEKTYKRTFAHVQDLSKSIIFAIKNFEKMKHSIFNIGDNSNNYSKEEIALKIKERIDYYLHFADIEADEDKRNYDVSYDKINSLGFKTAITVDEGIDELIKACHIFEFQHPYKNI
ncbi:MAG: NAD-dependent epimerase/dehydratase family protein [Candidatus Hodarchaeota archaeon]